MLRRVLLLSLAAGGLFCAPAAALRFEFEVLREGERLAGSEICFQPAASGDDAIARWFSSSDLRCFPADQVLDFPAGRWNYFARHAEGWISANPQQINLDVAKEESGYRRSVIVVQPAATIDVSAIALPPGETLFLFFANRGSTYGSTIQPMAPGAAKQLIPAGTDVIPIVARGGKPVRLLEPVNAKAGTVVAARERKRAKNTVDVIAWVQLDVEALRRLQAPEKLAGFDVRLRRGRNVIAQQFPMRNGAASHLSLATFVDVPKGRAMLELFGPEWQPFKREITIDGDLLVVEEPVTSTPAARISARWELPPGSVPAGDAPCEPAGKPQHVLARLQRCAGGGRCELVNVEQVKLAETGEVHFTGLAPGSYSVDAMVAGLWTTPVTVETRAGEVAPVDITPRAVVVRGRVTRDETALSAVLRFRHGAARTDPLTGQYAVLLQRDVGPESVVRIEPCDGSPMRMEIVPVALSDGTMFDLHLRDDAAAVEVLDARHDRPVARAAVTYAALSLKGEVAFAMRVGETGADGRMEIKNIPAQPLRICARAPEYEEACVEVARAEGRREARVRLEHVGGRRGRIISESPVTGALLYFSAANGELLETARVRDDGTFDCVCDGRAAYVAVVSDAHPLALLPPPAAGTGEIVITIPARSAGRELQVALAPSAGIRGGRVSLAIDGRVVPLAALTNHQLKRRLPTIVAAGASVRVADIAGHAIEVILLPLFEDLPPALAGKDVATLPEWQVLLPRQPLGPAGRVLFQ